MDKLTQFFSDLSTNTDKLTRFNSGLDKAEIATNRKRMLNAAGIKHAEDLISMPAKELQKLIEQHLAIKTDNRLESTICGLISKQMFEHPEQIAIIDGYTEIDYEHLMMRASEVSGELVSRGVEPGSLVGVCMNRSWELVAALIGVMQAGCAYVPLDPTYPQDRVRYMLKHSRAKAAIIDNDNAANLFRPDFIQHLHA